MNWLMPSVLSRLTIASWGRGVLTCACGGLFALGGVLNPACAAPQSTPTAQELYEQDLSGRLQQQIQNDPVLNPQQLPELKAPEAKPEPAPQPEDETATKVTVQEFVVEGNVLATTQEIQDILKPWLNTPISLNELRRGAAQVAALYRNKGYLGQAVLPNQDITAGVVRVVVVEGKVGKIIIDAPTDQPQVGPFLINRIETLLQHKLAAGVALNFNDFDWSLLVADDLPGVSVRGALQAGTEPGTTDVLVQVVPSLKTRGVVSSDNNGSRNTGTVRLNAQVQFESAMGWGETFNISGTKNEGSEYLRVAHSIPFGFNGWKGLTLNVDASRLDYQVLTEYKPDGAIFNPKGQSDTWGWALRYPFVRNSTTTVNGEFGYENRRSVDKGDTVVAGSSSPVLDVTRDTRVEALNLSLNLNHNDSYGGGGSNLLQATYTQGDMTLLPDSVRDDDIDAANTVGNYRKLRFTATRLQFIDAKHTAFVSFTGQFADRNLDSSEKLYLGGSSSIRAYPNSELGGSEGYVASLELRRDWNARWQTSYFYDYGKVWQYKNFQRADDPTQSLLTDIANAQVLKGQGFTFTYRHPNGLELKATVSRRTSPNPVPTEEGTDKDGTLRMNRWWFSASMPF